jgi:sphingosine kinase
LVNPVGGKGKARAIVRDSVRPILEAAGCIVDMKGDSAFNLHILMLIKSTETTHSLHAEEIAQEVDLTYE